MAAEHYEREICKIYGRKIRDRPAEYVFGYCAAGLRSAQSFCKKRVFQCGTYFLGIFTDYTDLHPHVFQEYQ